MGIGIQEDKKITLKRLIFACYNVFPGATKIKVVKNTGEKIYTGLWSDGCTKAFGDLKVLDFEIDEIKKNGVAKTLTAWVIKEDNNERQDHRL